MDRQRDDTERLGIALVQHWLEQRGRGGRGTGKRGRGGPTLWPNCWGSWQTLGLRRWTAQCSLGLRQTGGHCPHFWQTRNSLQF